MALRRPRPSQLTLAEDLFRAAQEAGWGAELEGRAGAYAADVVAVSDTGTTYLVEVKTGAHDLHFGALAQLAAAAASARSERSAGSVRAAVVTDSVVSPSTSAVAQELGIRIVSVAGRPALTGAQMLQDLRAPDDNA